MITGSIHNPSTILQHGQIVLYLIILNFLNIIFSNLTTSFIVSQFQNYVTTFALTDSSNPEDTKSDDSYLFNISTIRVATNNFAESNKLGEGGFVTVYKVVTH